MIQFISNYNKKKDTAECYLDLNKDSNENNYQIVFLEPNIVFGDKKAIFSLPNFTLDYRFGFDDEELALIVMYMQDNLENIKNSLKIGLEKVGA